MGCEVSPLWAWSEERLNVGAGVITQEESEHMESRSHSELTRLFPESKSEEYD
jgi:hypothetical protein